MLHFRRYGERRATGGGNQFLWVFLRHLLVLPCWLFVVVVVLVVDSSPTTDAFAPVATVNHANPKWCQRQDHRIISLLSSLEKNQSPSTDPTPKPPSAKVKQGGKGNNSHHLKPPKGRKPGKRPPSKQRSSVMRNYWWNLNSQIVQCQDASQVLQLLQSTPNALTRKAGGGALNMVNFSTLVHRLARHSLKPQARAPLLKDARFALFLAALAEYMLPNNDSELGSAKRAKFKSRELSNTAWGLAKLRVVPPATALPLQTNAQETEAAMEATAREIRECVLESAKARRNNPNSVQSTSAPWVTLVSKLAGLILDDVRFHAKQGVGKNAQVSFQQQEIANILWAWATSGRAETQFFGDMVLELIQIQKRESGQPLNPQEWSNSIWACATAGVYHNHDTLLEYVATTMENDGDFVARFKPQEISNTLWGVATLLSKKEGALTEVEQTNALKIERILVQAIVQRSLDDFKTQEVTNIIWSLATLGFGLFPSEELLVNNYIVLPTNDLEGDRDLLKRGIHAIVARALEIGRFAKSQELNNIAWSLARLIDDENQRTPEIDVLLGEIGRELGDPRRPVKSQDIGTTLWSLASLSYNSDPDIYRALCARLRSINPSNCKPQELSNSLWGIATAEIDVFDRDAFDTTLLYGTELPSVNDPIVACFGIAAVELMRRPDDFKEQEIKDVLWSFSKTGIRHPRLFRFVAEYLVGATAEEANSARGLHEFPPQGIGNMAWAFARQAQMCEDASARLKGSTMVSTTTGRLAVYKTSYFDIGENLLHRLFLAIAETGLLYHKNLSILKPQDLSNTGMCYRVPKRNESSFWEWTSSHTVFVRNSMDVCRHGIAS